MTSPEQSGGSPAPATPGRRRWPAWKILATVVGGLIVVFCGTAAIAGITGHGGSSSSPAKAAAAPATQAAAPATKAAKPATSPSVDTSNDSRICQVTDNGGTYYLNVTSAMEHNFSVCTGGTTYTGTIDNLLELPGMDRRCILPNDAIKELHALVGVYADSKQADLSAAKAFCDQYHATNN